MESPKQVTAGGPAALLEAPIFNVHECAHEGHPRGSCPLAACRPAVCGEAARYNGARRQRLRIENIRGNAQAVSKRAGELGPDMVDLPPRCGGIAKSTEDLDEILQTNRSRGGRGRRVIDAQPRSKSSRSHRLYHRAQMAGSTRPFGADNKRRTWPDARNGRHSRSALCRDPVRADEPRSRRRATVSLMTRGRLPAEQIYVHNPKLVKVMGQLGA